MKCPSGPQCPVCASPTSLQGQGLVDHADLSCTLPVIPAPGRDTPLETELSEIQSSEAFREPLGTAFLGLSDQQGNSVDLSCNITHSSDSQDITPPPDLSLLSSSPLPLALSLSLECPVERQSYEKLWRILAYYSETAVRLEREIMLSKAPALAYRYRQAADIGGYYHTGVKASVKARPQWLLQPAISIQLNRAQSNGHKVHLIYSTRVSAHPGPTSSTSPSSSATHQWVLISTNQTVTALAAVAGSMVELSCPLLSSGNPRVHWILPDGSKLTSPSSSPDDRLRTSATGLLLQKVQLSDAGLYYCVAQAGRDVDVLPLRLAVEDSSVPSLGVQVGPPITGTEGEAISLSCKASGSPVPHISWVLPDGNILQWGSTVSGGLSMDSNGSLFLPMPSLRDSGYYRCFAVNQYGSDSLSMHLELKPPTPPPLRPSFPRGPQSAAGRSTKIRAPLLRQMEEGSGNEEEEEEGKTTLISNRKQLRPLQPPPSRRYPIGKPQQGSVSGRPVSSSNKRRYRFQNRNRTPENKQRLDPKKWADLLAKIRQKTAHTNNNRPPSPAGKSTVEAVGRSKDRGTAGHEGGDEEAGVEAETEGSSVDETVLQEEDLQSIRTVIEPTKPTTHPHTETDTRSQKQTEKSTETQTQTDSERKEETGRISQEKQTVIEIQTQNPDPQTESVTNPEMQKESVTLKPSSGTNDIIPAPAGGDEQETNINPSGTRQGLLPNLIPNSRPQSPWNSRRRIGQRRRINRPRGKPLIPPRPLPDPTNQKSQTAASDSDTDENRSSTIKDNDIKIASNGVTSNPLTFPVSFTSESSSPSPTPFTSSLTSLPPSHKKTHIDLMTHSADIPDTAESPTPASTHAADVISPTHVADPLTRTLTPDIQIHTKTHTALGKHVERPRGKHSEELEGTLPGVSYASPSTTESPFFVASSTVTRTETARTAKITATPSTSLEHMRLTSSAASTTSPTTSCEESLPMTTVNTPTTSNPTPSSTTTISKIATSITAIPTSTTTTHNPKSSAPIATTTALLNPSSTTFNAKTEFQFKPNPTTPDSTTTFTLTTNTIEMTTVTTSPTTIKAITSLPPTATSTTVMTSIGTRASPRTGSNIGQITPGGRPDSAAPNQSRPPPDWKNPGANSIPDSHSSRPQSPSLPAVPWVSSNQFK